MNIFTVFVLLVVSPETAKKQKLQVRMDLLHWFLGPLSPLILMHLRLLYLTLKGINQKL